MNSSTMLLSSFVTPKTPCQNLRFTPAKPHIHKSAPFSPHSLTVTASSPSSNHHCRGPHKLESLAKSAVLIGALVSAAGKLSKLPAKAEPLAPTEVVQESIIQDSTEETKEEPLAELLESNEEAVEALRRLLQQKLDEGEDEEALKVLERLVQAQPEETEWRFLTARLLNELGRHKDAREMFEEILSKDPLSFEALFENALLMDRCGEGEAVIRRLQEALDVAEEEKKEKEARDVRLVMAQMRFLQKDIEGALKSYQELTMEDPNDFRPYFCRGIIYSLMGRNAEAKEQFGKYRELSPKKFEVEGYLRTSLSKMKLFNTDERN